MVETAWGALDPDGPHVALLRALDDEPGGTLAYADLYAEASDVGNSMIRRRVGRLRDLDLIAMFGPSTDRKSRCSK